VTGASPDAEESLAQAAGAGIHLLPIPTPFRVGRINCYLLEDDPLTLIDTGPNSGKSLDELELALGRLGRRIEELELIVITHQHPDHLGLLEIVARRSGAEVAALDLLARYLADFGAAATTAADDAFTQAIMRRHGIPANLATVLGAVGAAFRAFGCSATVTQPLRDGDELTLRDRTLQVMHRPGHSPTDTLFWDEQREILFAGDHLLARISSNPLISRPPVRGCDVSAAAPGQRPRALIAYIESMRTTRELPARLVLGGHGEPILDHVALIDDRLRQHKRRARKVLSILRERPLSAYEIALRMWGDVAVTQAFLTISEVLGHLDLLLKEGSVAEHDDGEHSRFEALPHT
jgi:glyoxylase-like metal-dependent hydrolase (beta-lactamase superfamily II)